MKFAWHIGHVPIGFVPFIFLCYGECFPGLATGTLEPVPNVAHYAPPVVGGVALQSSFGRNLTTNLQDSPAIMITVEINNEFLCFNSTWKRSELDILGPNSFKSHTSVDSI